MVEPHASALLLGSKAKGLPRTRAGLCAGGAPGDGTPRAACGASGPGPGTGPGPACGPGVGAGRGTSGMASGGTSCDPARRLRADAPTVALRGGSCTTGHAAGPVARRGSAAAAGGVCRGHAAPAGRVARWAGSPAGREMGQAPPGGIERCGWGRSGEPPVGDSVCQGAGPGRDRWRQKGEGPSGGGSAGEAGVAATGVARSQNRPGELVTVASVGRRARSGDSEKANDKARRARSGDLEGANDRARGAGPASGGLKGRRVFGRAAGAARDRERVCADRPAGAREGAKAVARRPAAMLMGWWWVGGSPKVARRGIHCRLDIRRARDERTMDSERRGIGGGAAGPWGVAAAGAAPGPAEGGLAPGAAQSGLTTSGSGRPPGVAGGSEGANETFGGFAGEGSVGGTRVRRGCRGGRPMAAGGGGLPGGLPWGRGRGTASWPGSKGSLPSSLRLRLSRDAPEPLVSLPDPKSGIRGHGDSE